MADEDKKTEEVKTEETSTDENKTEETKVEETKTDEQKDEAPKKVMEAMTKFDDIVEKSGSDDDSTEEVEEKAAEEKDTGDKEEVVVEETAEDKLNAAADALEKEIEAEAGKSAAEKQADVDAKAKADEDAKVAADEKKEAEKFSSGLPTGEGEFDEEYVKAMDKMGQGFQDENKVLAQQNADLVDQIKSQANQRLNDILDRKFDALGDEFTEVLGKGETEDLELDSVEYENRGKVLSRMGLMVQLHIKTDKPIPSTTKLFNSAVSYLFKKEKNKPATDAKTTKDLKKRANQVVGKASQTSSTPTAAEKSKQAQKHFDDIIKNAD